VILGSAMSRHECASDAAYFSSHFRSVYPGVAILLQDEGSALMSEEHLSVFAQPAVLGRQTLAALDLPVSESVFVANCAFHAAPHVTSAGGVGKSNGMREIVYKFARSRTDESAAIVVSAAGAVKPEFGQELIHRQHALTLSARLNENRPSNGTIATGAAEGINGDIQ
jgi:hypothetical protein